MKKVNLLRRFSLICAVALIVMVTALGLLITRIYEENEIGHVRNHLARYIEAICRKDLTERDFVEPLSGIQYLRFFDRISDVLNFP